MDHTWHFHTHKFIPQTGRIVSIFIQETSFMKISPLVHHFSYTKLHSQKCHIWPITLPYWKFHSQMWHFSQEVTCTKKPSFSAICWVWSFLYKIYPYFAGFLGMNLCVRKCHVWSIAKSSAVRDWLWAQDLYIKLSHASLLCMIWWGHGQINYTSSCKYWQSFGLFVFNYVFDGKWP